MADFICLERHLEARGVSVQDTWLLRFDLQKVPRRARVHLLMIWLGSFWSCGSKRVDRAHLAQPQGVDLTMQ